MLAMVARAICRILVGREQELSTLEDALLAACRGEGSVIVLAGDAGMGKTRLCTELASRAEKIGAAVMEGSCSEADIALPYLPFLEAIGNYLALADAGRVRESLGIHTRELARIFPQLSEEARPDEGQETTNARLRLFEAILALLVAASAERGLLLIIEDLHWADASTRELLDYLTRRFRNRRILVVTTYRKDEMDHRHPLLPTLQGWQRSRLARLVELEPLPPKDVARMVSSIFDDVEVDADFRDFIHGRTEGNPFVLEEMLKAAIDRGDIFRDASDWRRKRIPELGIPQTVRDAILLRVERLEPTQASVLRFAAVLGRSFDYRTLMALSNQDRATVESALQLAVDQQLIEEEAGARGRYRFRHALTQEAIYQSLSAPTRERLHSAAADVLAARPDPPIGEVAFHLRAANRWREAIQATLQAAEVAEGTRGYEEAASLYTQLLPVLTTGIDRARLMCRLGEAYWRASRPGKAIESLEEGVRLLENAGQLTEAAHYRLTLGRCRWESSESHTARAEYEKAVHVLEPAGPSRDLALGYIRLAGLHLFDKEPVAGKEFAELGQNTAEEARADDMRIWSYNYLALAVGQLGDYLKALQYIELSAQQASDKGFRDIAASALHNMISVCLGSLELDRLPDIARRLAVTGVESGMHFSRLYALTEWARQTGDLNSALGYASEWLRMAEEVEFAVQRNDARTELAWCLLELDRLDESRQYLAQLNPHAERQRSVFDAAVWIRFHLDSADMERALIGAEFLLSLPGGATLGSGGSGEVEAAVEAFVAAERYREVERMVAAVEPNRYPSAEVATDLARGRLALARGEFDAALPLVRGAVDRLDRAGFVMRACRGRLLLADVYTQRGDKASAQAELRHVHTLAREKGLHLLARQSRDQLIGLGVTVDEPAAARQQPAPIPQPIGERLVTTMFADARGYSLMTAQRPPAEMVDKVAALHRWAAAEVQRHHGMIDKFAGDAVMATFNVTGTHVDHANDALLAAFALRDKASLLGLPIGVGIATGAAVVGSLKDGANMSVIGQTTNLASRLQAKAAAGEILISEETYRRLRERPDSRMEHLELKGFEVPMTAFRILAPASASPE